MKQNDIFTKLFACFIGIMFLFGACSIVNDYLGLKDDNEAEEQLENVIEHHTGIRVDLTPESDE